MNLTRASALVAVTPFSATVLPTRVHAQEIRAVGGHLGRTSSRQLWSGALGYISFPVVRAARLFRNPVGIYAYKGRGKR